MVNSLCPRQVFILHPVWSGKLYFQTYSPPHVQTQFLRSRSERIWSVTTATPRSLESHAGNSPMDRSPLLQLGYGSAVAWGERAKTDWRRQSNHLLRGPLNSSGSAADGKPGHSLCPGTFVGSAAARARCLGLFATVSPQSSASPPLPFPSR